jgi:hypothetical protein
MEQVLCAPPPDPPPGVEGLVRDKKPTGTLRQQMEQHRQDPKCSVCHTSMDAIGFGLEPFDGVGAERTEDLGFAIDASGELPGGAKFNGPAELSATLAHDARFARCLAQQMYIYALGRGMAGPDYTILDGITSSFAAKDHRLKELIKLIVRSPAFRMRRGDPGGAP